MADSSRQLILNYIRDTVLARITTGNGYNTTVATRQRGLLQIDALPESGFPALFIAKADEDRGNITRNQFLSKLKVMIVGYVKNSTGVNELQQELDDLIEDVGKALEQDRTLENTGSCKWLNIDSVVTDDGDTPPHGAFAMSVEVNYAKEGITP